MARHAIAALLLISLHTAYTWEPPDRCKQGKWSRSKRESTVYPTLINSASYANSIIAASVIENITEVALKQNKYLNETYIDSKFFGVPIRGSANGCDNCDYEVYFPNSCKFYTYNPRLLSSVYCQDGIACKLTHTVSTIKSYASSEGYNWGIKLSAKASFGSVFEVGGEISSGDSYTCTYTEGRTTTESVECSVPSGSGQTLELYNVQSDMECQFSTVTVIPDTRNGEQKSEKSVFIGDKLFNKLSSDAIIRGIKDKVVVILPNLDRLDDSFLEFLKSSFPDYEAYTDLLHFNLTTSSNRLIDSYVMYYKQGQIASGPKRVIPFTNENGDSIYQYACVLT